MVNSFDGHYAINNFDSFWSPRSDFYHWFPFCRLKYWNRWKKLLEKVILRIEKTFYFYQNIKSETRSSSLTVKFVFVFKDFVFQIQMLFLPKIRFRGRERLCKKRVKKMSNIVGWNVTGRTKKDWEIKSNP